MKLEMEPFISTTKQNLNTHSKLNFCVNMLLKPSSVKQNEIEPHVINLTSVLT